MRFPEVNGGVHVCTCITLPVFCERIVLFFFFARGPQAMCLHRTGDICPSACVTGHTCKYIYSLPLVHRPKGILLVGLKFGMARELGMGADFGDVKKRDCRRLNVSLHSLMRSRPGPVVDHLHMPTDHRF